MRRIKIAYIGGGSKEWAHVFMNDLAFVEGFSGEIALYDIDLEAAKRNQKIGNFINKDLNTKTKWSYQVYERLDDALLDADFVAISILPATFDEMRSDVHEPETYAIYQTVGDTTGPGGVLRSMRTVPLYEEFARKIKAICPDAWVLNFTNPMNLCVKTLYDVFPEIKAVGCCHEVFHTQNFLCKVLAEETGIKATRKDISTDVSGINHFTWISQASYKNLDLLNLLDNFMLKYGESGYNERGEVYDFLDNPFRYANLVKMDLYRRYGVLGAAGDRHLVEFMAPDWYLRDSETIKKFKFARTSVDERIKKREKRLKELEKISSGEEKPAVKASDEEAVAMIKALLGFGTLVTNVNLPNLGQMPGYPRGAIVETNAVFSNDRVVPVIAKELPKPVKSMLLTHIYNLETLYEGIKKRDLKLIFSAFLHDPLCAKLSFKEAEILFKKMVENTRAYLEPYYDLKTFLSK
ncbi:MAG: alpha-glucosidase/alpha-galactosidase [Bacilli bacterium]|jgi:alpha-galactosidase